MCLDSANQTMCLFYKAFLKLARWLHCIRHTRKQQNENNMQLIKQMKRSNKVVEDTNQVLVGRYEGQTAIYLGDHLVTLTPEQKEQLIVALTK